MSNLQLALLVADAQAGKPQAIVDALLMVCHYHDQDQAPPEPLRTWFADCVTQVLKGVDLNADPAKQQRAFARAFSMTQSRGRPSQNGTRDFKAALDVYHIHKSQGIGLPKAMAKFLDDNPDFTDSGSLDPIRDAYNKHKEAVIDLYEEWLEHMDKN